MPLDSYVEAITGTLAATPNEADAHRLAIRVLTAMTMDSGCLREVLLRYLDSVASAEPAGRTFQTGFTILRAPRIGLSANFWFPGRPALAGFSAVPIHHHGVVHLTTTTAFGPGYRHFLFDRVPEKIPTGQTYRLTLQDCRQHPRSNAIFIDAFQPHTFGFPAALSITYVLWSHLGRAPDLQSPPRCMAFRLPAGPMPPGEHAVAAEHAAQPWPPCDDLPLAVADMMASTDNADLIDLMMTRLRGCMPSSSNAGNALRLLKTCRELGARGHAGAYLVGAGPRHCVDLGRIARAADYVCVQEAA